MVLGIILAGISAGTNIIELNTQETAAQDSLQERVDSLQNIVRTSRNSADWTKRIDSMKEASNKVQDSLNQLIDDLTIKLNQLNDSLLNLSQHTSNEIESAINIIANYLSQDIQTTGQDKINRVSESEKQTARCIFLRRSVFTNMTIFNAEIGILENALYRLTTDLGYQKYERCSQEVINTFSQLKTMRLRWLQDKAIPALQRELDANLVTQQAPSAEVRLPEEFVIVDVEQFGYPKETVTSMTSLREEVELLQNSFD